MTKGLTFHKQTRLHYTSAPTALALAKDFASDIRVRYDFYFLHESNLNFFHFLMLMYSIVSFSNAVLISFKLSYVTISFYAFFCYKILVTLDYSFIYCSMRWRV